MVYGPIDGKMTKLEYDCRNRLIKAGEITYEYDPENNRIATNTRQYREEYVNNASASLVQVLEINRYKTEDDINDNGTKAYETTVCYYGNGLEYEITLNYKTTEKTFYRSCVFIIRVTSMSCLWRSDVWKCVSQEK